MLCWRQRGSQALSHVPSSSPPVQVACPLEGRRTARFWLRERSPVVLLEDTAASQRDSRRNPGILAAHLCWETVKHRKHQAPKSRSIWLVVVCRGGKATNPLCSCLSLCHSQCHGQKKGTWQMETAKSGTVFKSLIISRVVGFSFIT